MNVLGWLVENVDGDRFDRDPEAAARDLMHAAADVCSVQMGIEQALSLCDYVAANAGDLFAALGRGAVIGATEAGKRLRGRAHLRVVK